MAQHLRFAALAAALFVLAYGGVAWFVAGRPLPAFYASLSKSQAEQPTPVAFTPSRIPQPDQSNGYAARTDTSARTPQPDQNNRYVSRDNTLSRIRSDQSRGYSPRDKLRLAALQASEEYVLAPCERTAKANLIAAVGAYAKAWQDVMGCSPGGCDLEKLNAAAAAFSTPLDTRVREAVDAAFDKRGISIDDFPPPLRINVAMLVRGRGDSGAACVETHAQVAR